MRRNLNVFYATVIAAIRVDPATPAMTDAGWYAAADGFNYWTSGLSDKKVLYSFHMYEPYAATSAPNMKRERPFSYPGKVPFGEDEESWDKDRVAAYLVEPVKWAKDKGASRSIAWSLVSSAACVAGRACKAYLEDVLTALDKENLHQAFYSFREDSWDGMDYELGSKKVPWKYWEAIDAGRPDPVKRTPAPEFKPISKRLIGTRSSR